MAGSMGKQAKQILGDSAADHRIGRRLDALADLHILDSATETGFDDLARLAAHSLNAPVALITFIDDERQWFKASVGAAGIRQTAIKDSICSTTIEQPGMLIVPDLVADPRFAAMMPVAQLGMRFYAGVAFTNAAGVPVGTICVLDGRPRPQGLTEGQAEALMALGRATQRELELRQTVGHLKKTKERYQALISASSAVVWLNSGDKEGMLDGEWNAFTGNTSNAMTGDEWLESVHPDDRPGVEAIFRVSQKAGVAYDRQYRLRHASGDYRWVDVRAVPIRGADGGIAEWVGTTTDIDDRRRAEEALRESEEHYRYTVELSPQIPWTADPQGNILEAGPQWHLLMGMSREETLGTGWAQALHPDDHAATFATWGHSLATGEPVDTHYRLRLATGDYRWMRARASARLAADGSVMRWYGSVEDVHDHVCAQQALEQSEAFARSVLDSSSNAIEVLDLAGHLQFINEAGVRIFEDDDAESVHGFPYEYFYQDDAKPLVLGALDRARAGEKSRYDIFSPTLKGTPRWWDVAISPILGADGQVERILVLSSDITETKTAQAAMAEANARFSAVLETTMDCVIVVDRDWRITYVNQNTMRQSGRDVAPIGQDLREILSTVSDIPHLKQAMEQQISMEFEAHIEAVGVWLELHASGSRDGLTIFFRDVTEQRQARGLIEHQAYHDALTGLPNRALLRNTLQRVVGDASRASALLLLDLDDFKSINDAFGHPAGDRLLVEVAKRLSHGVGERGLIARLGGDEFAVVLNDAEDAANIAAAIVTALSDPLDINGRAVRIGVSIGLACAPLDADEPDELFARADMALYEAKAAGGRAVRQFNRTLQSQSLAREALKLDLAEALDKNQLHIVYQPQLDLASRTISGFEALLRWNHPQRGPISPVEFIPLAEESGLINAIGDWVLHQACQQAQAWPENISVSVNLSPVQFKHKSLPLRVLKALFLTDLKPERLTLEVTESVLLQHTEDNLALLDELRALGVHIALDDFGTGYSSLSYLRDFKFDEIKIDRAFVRDIDQSEQACAIIRAVADLGRALGVVTTAEGVETQGQLKALSALGYDHGQGFYFSRPVSPAEATSMVALERRARRA